MSEQSSPFLSTTAATSRDRRIALSVVVVSVLVFLVAAPFATKPLSPLPGFIPFYQSALAINDLVTAVLLFGQFSLLRSRALLLLAGAYLFTACMAIVHAFTFPGVFSPTGLLGAGPQTTAWMYMFWHGSFPILVIAYAHIRDGRFDTAKDTDRGSRSVLMCVAAVLAGACGITLLATTGHDLLPRIMRGNGYAPALTVVVGCILLLSIAAAIAVWRRKSRSVLDLWLMVSMCALSFDIALSGGLNAGRYDLGFYVGRIYGLMATSFVLVVLLLESNRLYALLVQTQQSDRAKAIELRRLSTLDPLTRIANRRAFEEAIDQEWRRTLRHRMPLCLLMIDVDCFKRFNDRYGHVAGDQCLREVAQALARNARRAGEVAARYGGEEFAVLLPLVGLEEAHRLAERICQDVRDLDIPHAESTVTNHVTISVGVADALTLATRAGSLERSEDTGMTIAATMLVEGADAALYAAKVAGRNRVALAPCNSLLTSGSSVASAP